jgi:threonine/homoserine/homoserine lactone efflux protein
MRKNLLHFIKIFLLLLVSASIVNAQATTTTTSTLENVLIKIKETLKTLGYVVCAIFMIWGGYQMVTASGDPKQFEKGRNTLLYAAIGFVVILLADNIVDWIKSIIS